MILSRRQAKNADRVGGIELLIVYPDDLGAPPAVGLDLDIAATQRERACAERLVGESCREHGLVPVHVRVAREVRPAGPGVPHPGEDRVHLAITIIGRRWVHATGRPRPIVMYA